VVAGVGVGVSVGNHTGLFAEVRGAPKLKLLGGLVDTLATFHALMFWLNTDAEANI
jgi:hypothetical protein